MATAALRAVLVVAAVVLGVFVLSRAFPSGNGEATPPQTPAETTPPPSPTSPPPTEEPTIQETRDPSDIRVQVLNATDVTGLAGDAAAMLEEQGYDIVTIGNYAGEVAQTTVFFRPAFQADAQALMEQQFTTAALEEATADVRGGDLTVVLAQDYADAQTQA